MMVSASAGAAAVSVMRAVTTTSHSSFDVYGYGVEWLLRHGMVGDVCWTALGLQWLHGCVVRVCFCVVCSDE
jgi:hypothetical protein